MSSFRACQLWCLSQLRPSYELMPPRLPSVLTIEDSENHQIQHAFTNWTLGGVLARGACEHVSRRVQSGLGVFVSNRPPDGKLHSMRPLLTQANRLFTWLGANAQLYFKCLWPSRLSHLPHLAQSTLSNLSRLLQTFDYNSCAFLSESRKMYTCIYTMNSFFRKTMGGPGSHSVHGSDASKFDSLWRWSELTDSRNRDRKARRGD